MSFDDGVAVAREQVKTILKRQRFMTFNIKDQYSIRPFITSREIDKFLHEILDWVFQEMEGTQK